MFRFALLICDTPAAPVVEKHGDYYPIWTNYLKETIPNPDVEFILDGFDVVDKQEYPSLDAGYDGVIITGSVTSVNAGLPWITRLIEYVRTLGEKRPEVKIIGICFGHQIVGVAFGSECVLNDDKWEVGVTEIELTDLGKEIFGQNTISIQQGHRDHVPELPPKFLLLGSTAITMNQGMILRYDDNPFKTHVFCVEGHPEFTADMMHDTINVREKSGIMSFDIAREGRARAGRRQDGRGAIARAIWKALGVEVN